MADALTVRGFNVTVIEQLPQVLGRTLGSTSGPPAAPRKPTWCWSRPVCVRPRTWRCDRRAPGGVQKAAGRGAERVDEEADRLAAELDSRRVRRSCCGLGVPGATRPWRIALLSADPP